MQQASATNICRSIVLMFALLLIEMSAKGQGPLDTLQDATLKQVVEYALGHQPLVQEALLNEEITKRQIKGKIADWFPQVNLAYNYQHFIDLQSAFIGGNVIRFGVKNTSSFQFTGTENLFNRDVLLAGTTASQVKGLAAMNTSQSKIDLVVNVTKAFYDVLATMQQIKVTQESIIRVKSSLNDAYSRYTSGVADKTDYKRATILLNNAEAALKTNTELLKYKKQALKALMGYPPDGDLPLQYNPDALEQEIAIDTTELLNYSANIDYRILKAQKDLQDENVRYEKWSFIPSLSAFGAYDLNYQNNNFSELYNRRYPYSYVGATVSFPLFEGGKRLWKVQEQKLTSMRMEQGLVNMENNLSAEYTRAIGSYKGNLANYQAQKENVDMAQEVYDIIRLQYDSGIKTYLDVTTAESDLNTAKINYYNALYMVLASKMDVLRALGEIQY